MLGLKAESIGDASIGELSQVTFSEFPPYVHLLADEFAEYHWVVKINVKRFDQIQEQSLDGPIQETAIGSFEYRGVEFEKGTFFYYGDRPMSTIPSDQPANLYIPGRLTNPMNYQSGIGSPIPTGPKPLGRSGGTVKLENSDGSLDFLLNSSLEGRRIEVLVGGKYNIDTPEEVTMPFKHYKTVFRGIVGGVQSSIREITVNIESQFRVLRQEIQPKHYDGEGDFGGAESLLDTPIPLAYGRIFNAAPKLVNSGFLVYQFHDGSMEEVESIRDSGVELTPHNSGANDIADLGLSSIMDWIAEGNEGQYITDLSNGYVRLAASPLGGITGDIKGDNSGGYISRTEDIIRRIIEVQGDVLTFQDDFNKQSFRDFQSHGDIGFYISSSVLINNVILELAAAEDAYLVFDREGRLQIGRYQFTNDSQHVIDDSIIKNISIIQNPDPIWSAHTEFMPNWAPQDQDALAAIVSEEDKTLYSAEFSERDKINADIRYTIPSATKYVHKSFFHDSDVAADLNSEFLSRSIRYRNLYQVTLVGRKELLRYCYCGDVTLVTDKFGVGTKRCVVLQIAENVKQNTTTLQLWG